MNIRHRFSRRQILRAAGTVGAALTAAPLLGVLDAPVTLAAPAATHGVLNVPIQLYIEGISVNATSTKLIQEYLDKTINGRIKGARAIFQPQGNAGGVVSAMLAGASYPWIVSSCCTDWPVLLPFLENLDPYITRDNIDEHAIWGVGQLSRFREPNGLFGLPEDAASDVYLYRQDILDDLGLPYPSPDWTWSEAETLWRRCTGNVHGQWRYGTNCPFGPGTTEGLPTVVAAYGGSFMDATHTRCLLNEIGSIHAGEYWFHMVWDKVATWGDGVPNPAIVTGQLVFNTSADPTVLFAVTQLGTKVKWDFCPWPSFPVRSVGKLHDNFYAMMASVPNKELAWTLLKWIAVEKEWYQFYMHVALTPPARADMMDEWYAVLRATAPILANKHLEYWGDPTLRGEGIYDYEFFQYSPSQAQSIISTVWPNIWNQKTGVTAGFQQITEQVNALEAAGAATAQTVNGIQAALGAVHNGQYPLPTATGSGAPATSATALVSVRDRTVTMTAGGSGIGASADSCVMAAATFTPVDGDVVCRLDAFSLASGPHLSQWAMAGLMARNDLSSVAPMVAVAVTAGDGLAVISRVIQMPGDVVGTPAVQMGAQGLLTQQQLTTYPPSAAQGNVMRRPLWLRLSRRASMWTAYTSVDGSTWTVAGQPVQVQVAGCWVGPFAAANNLSTGGVGTVRASFSQLSAAPSQAVQIGRP
jgi:ABC-type glycerol-3-phosphate transport system substrate-binding protein